MSPHGRRMTPRVATRALGVLAFLLPLIATASGPGCFGIKGVALASFGWDGYGSETADTAQHYIRSLGGNLVALVRPYEVNTDTGLINPDTPALPTDQHLEHAVTLAHSLGLRTELKLHFLDPRNHGDVLAGSHYSPSDPGAFFDSYRRTVLQNAALAQRLHVDIFVFATELGGLITGNPKFRPYFVDLVDSIRKVYFGKLSIATQISTHVEGFGSPNGPRCIDRKDGRNWCLSSDEASFVTFWDKLDYIGIDPYANLSNKDDPTYEDLVAAYHHDLDGRDFLGKLEGIVHRAGDRPLLISEVGAPSVKGAQRCTGCWENIGPADPGIQALIYRAMLDAFCRESNSLHLAGLVLWSIDAFPDERAKQDPRGVDPVGFTFVHKPAEDVVRAAFGDLGN